MSKKIHPADEAERQLVLTAASFNVHFRMGPHDVLNHRVATLQEAVAAADLIARECPGRRASIYAISANGKSAIVPNDIIQSVRQAPNQ